MMTSPEYHCISILFAVCFYLTYDSVNAQRWTKEPANPTEVEEGKEVEFTWNYDLEGGTVRSIAWSYYDPDKGQFRTLVEKLSSDPPDVFEPRFSVNVNGANTTLTLTNVSRTDGKGTFSCEVTYRTASNALGRLASTAVRLNVLYPPEIVEARASASPAVEDSEVVLVCIADGNPTPHVAWIAPNGTTLQNRTGDTNLTFPSVSRDNKGTYRCEATNGIDPSDSATVTLEVFYSAKVSKIGSLFTPVEGGDVQLVCAAEGFPAPHVAWIAPNGSYLQNGTGEARFSLTDLSRHDQETYRCNATNQLGSDSSTFKLGVLYDAKILLAENVTAIEGDDAVLVCEVEGNPTPWVAWVAPNGSAVQNRTSDTNLTLHSVSRNSGGPYKCIATNEVGTGSVTIYLNVLLPAKILLAENVTTRERNDTVLVCKVEGNPTLWVAWSAPNGIAVQNRTSDTDLRLPSVSRDSGGSYSCSVTNGLGTDTERVYLDVQYPPENTSFTADQANTSAVIRGTTVNFECTSTAHPPVNEFRFLRNGEQIRNGISGKFSINRLESGSYVCEAVNKVGREKSEEINITVVLLPTVSPPSNRTVVEGLSTTIQCNAAGTPAPSIEWTRVSDSQVVSSSSELYLSNVPRPGNAGQTVQYRCTARNGYGVPASAVVTVYVYSANDSKCRGYQITLLIELFTKAYEDKGSNEFREFEGRFRIQVRQTLKNITILGVRVDKLSGRNGSVVVNFTIFVANNDKLAEQVDSMLRKAVDTGKLGTFTVDETSLRPKRSTPASTTSARSTTVSPYWSLTTISIFIIILTSGVIWYRKRQRNREDPIQSPKKEEEEEGLKDGANGDFENSAYAEDNELQEIPLYAQVDKSKKTSEVPGTGYVQVNRESATGTTEGNYAEVGGAGGGVPAVTYASVDKSKDKKKKKKTKGQKLENNELQEIPVYAQVDKSKKTSEVPKKPTDSEVLYADLDQLSDQKSGMTSVQVSPPVTLGPIKRPPKYEETQYADISQFSLKRKEVKPAKGEGGKHEGGTEGNKTEGEAERDKPDGEAEVETAASPEATPSAVTLVKEGEENDSKM